MTVPHRAEIQGRLLDPRVPLATALRELIVFADSVGDENLAIWARSELYGWPAENPAPGYRRVGAPIHGVSTGADGLIIRDVAITDLAVEAQPAIRRMNAQLTLRQGVGVLEHALAAGPDPYDQTAILRIELPEAALLAQAIPRSAGGLNFHTLHWAIGAETVREVLARIRRASEGLIATVTTSLGRETPPETLRILILCAAAQGDLRITREHSRIREAVVAAKYRDRVEIEPRLSATTRDLQEGIARFRPHIVHFSGHGDKNLLVFEDDRDDFHDEGEDVEVTGDAFVAACGATDTPPTLVVVNACRSKATADALVASFAPLAIGMTDAIDDIDALRYAGALYSHIVNGHSIGTAHHAGIAAVQLHGGRFDLPYLAARAEIEPANVRLIRP